MSASNRIRAYIKGKETLQLHAYDDGTGHWAIGWGHTCTPDHAPIDELEAEALFQSDILVAEQWIYRHVKVGLLQCELDALVSLVFNDGELGPSVLIYLNTGNKIEAASWICRYCHSGKTALKGLLFRRTQETQIFLGEKVEGY